MGKKFTTRIVPGDWTGVAHNFSRLDVKLNPGASPVFVSIGLTGLTENALMYADGSGVLTSLAAATNGQLVIGSTGAAPSVAALTGTASQIVVTPGAGSITLSTPQNIHTAATPTFAGATFSGLTASQIVGTTAGKALVSIPVIGNGLTLSGGNLYWAWLGINDLSESPTEDSMMVWNGAGNAVLWEDGATLRTTLGLGTGDSPTFAGGTFTGTVTGVTPTAGTHFATKEYVDLALGAFKTFFFSDTGSGVGALNYAYPHETGEAQSTIVTDPALGADDPDPQLIKGFITEAGEPATTTLHSGVIVFHLHAKKGASNQRTTVLNAILSKVAADGTSSKVTIATTENSAELTDTETTYTLHATLGADVEVLSTDRLILDVYASVGSGAQDSVVTFYMEGTEDSYFTTEVDSGIWQTYGKVLDDLNTVGQVGANSEFLVGTGAEAFAWESGNTVRTSLGLSIDSDVQAYDAGLASLAGLTYAAASFVKMTGANAFALRTIGETADDLEGTIDHGNLANLTIVAHDTTATGANLTSLTDDSMVDALHRHSELSASDGTPNQALIVDAAGLIGIGPISSMLAPLNITGDTAGIDDRHEGLWMRSKENAWIVQLNVRGPRLEIGGGASLDTTPAMSVNYNTGTVGIGVIPVTRLTVEGTITLKEQAAADGDTADYGQFWVKNTTPNQAYFTDDTGVDHRLRMGAVDQTINLLDSDSSAEKQAKIDAVPRYIPYGISVTFQFEVSNTHVETASLSWIGFYGGGDIFIYGNTAEGTALYSTQNTIIDSSGVAGSALVFSTNSVSIWLQNLKVIVSSSAGRNCITAANCFGLFRVIYNWFIEDGSNTLGNGVSMNTCIAMNATRNYFTGFKYGTLTSYGNGFLRDCEYLTTKPIYGTFSTQGANVGIRGNEVLGTTSDRHETFGGRIG